MGLFYKSLTMLVISSIATGASAATADEGFPLSDLITIEVLSITVPGAAAGTALAVGHALRNEARLASQFQTQTNIPVPAAQTGSAFIAESALQGTKDGDVISIRYMPATSDELREAVADLEQSKKQWERRSHDTTAEYSKAYRRQEHLKRILKSQVKLGGEQKDIDLLRDALKQAELKNESARIIAADAKGRFDLMRKQLEDAKRNLDTWNTSGKKVSAFVQRDILVDKTAGSEFAKFVQRVGTDKSRATELRRGPRVQISRTNLPDLEGSAKLMKSARQGFVVAGVMALVSLEELVIGAAGEALSKDVVNENAPVARNSRNAAVAR